MERKNQGEWLWSVEWNGGWKEGQLLGTGGTKQQSNIALPCFCRVTEGLYAICFIVDWNILQELF